MSNKKKKSSKLKMIQDYRLNEPFTFESSESQKEEILMTGSLQRAHAQLRRLRNDSSILKDAYITAIPHHKSKVFFKYTNVPKLSSFRSSTPIGKCQSRKLHFEILISIFNMANIIQVNRFSPAHHSLKTDYYDTN